MKYALAQMHVIAGDPEKNVATMLSMIREARQNGCDLIVFPEMCVGGYLVGDRWTEDVFCKELMSYNEIFCNESNNIAIAYGNIFVEPGNRINPGRHSEGYHPNKDGRARKYNAIYVYQNNKPAPRLVPTDVLPDGVVPKTLLPNYRFFDDQRYFFSLLDIARDFDVPFQSLLSPLIIFHGEQACPVGFELCEDLWCEDYRAGNQSINPTKHLIDNGARLIINCSSSPWTYGKNGARDRRVRFIAREIGEKFTPFMYVNCCGAQNNGKNIVTFDGGTTIYNSRGKPISIVEKAYSQELVYIEDHDFHNSEIERTEKSRIAQKFDAIIEGILHINTIMGKPRQSSHNKSLCIGLSGGVDSSVVAALVTYAMGPQNVIAITMPSQYNRKETIAAAEHVATMLGIEFLTVPIDELVTCNENVLVSALNQNKNEKLKDVLLENIQAKIRGTSILSNIAAQRNALFTNNGNKVEIATGYATLYGDVGGAIAPIGDLLKTEVFEMARYINAEVFHKEIIPEQLLPDNEYNFALPPSAELKQDQIDPFKWGYHDALLQAFTDYRKKSPDDILAWYLAGELTAKLGISEDILKRWGLNDQATFITDLEWFYSQIQRNIFKRIQSPPIIIVSKSAYGFDIRESQLKPLFSQTFLKQKQQWLKNSTTIP